MEEGEWRVEEGEWRVEGGRWRVGCDRMVHFQRNMYICRMCIVFATMSSLKHYGILHACHGSKVSGEINNFGPK